MTSVLLVDDHELIRQGLARAFERVDDMVVVGQAASLAAAIRTYDDNAPDVVVTDLELPDGSGLDLVRHARGSSDEVGLVVLTMHTADSMIFEALEAGASAFVSKDKRTAEVVTAAEHAAKAPRTFLCAELGAAMVRRAGAAHDRPRLSPRELEVLHLLAEGRRTSEISAQLYMSDSTTKTHIAHIYQKLEASNRAQAMVAAMRWGMLTGGPDPTDVGRPSR